MFTDACIETVSIVEAIVFGADGACIDIGIGSLLGGIAVFMLAVVVLRFAGMAVLRRLIPSLRPKSPPAAVEKADDDAALKPMPYESPIQSTGAWGGKRR